MSVCKNCHRQLTDRFCSHCGQKALIERITIPNLIRSLPHAIFHVDRGFLFNIIHLFKRPGKSISEYIEGRRKPFYHPASFLVVSLILNYIVVKITNLHFYDQEELKAMDPITAKAIVDYDALQWWFLEHTYIYILIAIPASSLFLYAIFKWMKQKHNLAETSVVVLFTIGQGVLIQSAIYLLCGWVPSGAFLRAMESVNMVILITYASLVIFHVLYSVKSRIKRLMVSFLGGIGLAAIWIASAFLLYILWS